MRKTTSKVKSSGCATLGSTRFSTQVFESRSTGQAGARRPDGSSYGFPSGHAGFVFSQAGFLQERYGWTYGVPALTMATAISYIRVREDKHHWRDVIAGGALGYGVAMITVTPIKATQIAPIIGPHWLGIRFSRSF
jgi:membrane-associated phospholipid phosphatase